MISIDFHFSCRFGDKKNTSKRNEVCTEFAWKTAENIVWVNMEPTFEFTGLPVWESAGSFDLTSDLLKTGEMLKVQSGLLSPNNMYRLLGFKHECL